MNALEATRNAPIKEVVAFHKNAPKVRQRESRTKSEQVFQTGKGGLISGSLSRSEKLSEIKPPLHREHF